MKIMNNGKLNTCHHEDFNFEEIHYSKKSFYTFVQYIDNFDKNVLTILISNFEMLRNINERIIFMFNLENVLKIVSQTL